MDAERAEQKREEERIELEKQRLKEENERQRQEQLRWAEEQQKMMHELMNQQRQLREFTLESLQVSPAPPPGGPRLAPPSGLADGAEKRPDTATVRGCSAAARSLLRLSRVGRPPLEVETVLGVSVGWW